MTEDESRGLEIAKETIHAAVAKLISELEASPFRLRAHEFRADFHLNCVQPARGHCLGRPIEMGYPIYHYAHSIDHNQRQKLREKLDRAQAMEGDRHNG